MADLSNLYDPADKPDERDDFAALPAGEYLVIIEGSEMKQTKAGTGEYLELTLQVIEGQYKGRKLWDRLNLKNPSKIAQDIARATFAVIRQAVGVLEPKNSTELHNKPLVAKVKQREYNGEAQNEIKGYRATKPGAKLPEPAPAYGAAAAADDIPF